MVDADSTAKDGIFSSDTEKKKVRFDAPSDEEQKKAAAERRKIANQQARAQRRFKAGNGQSRGLQGLFIPVGGLALLIVFGISTLISEMNSSSSEGKQQSSNKILEGDQINKFAKSMTDLLFEETEKKRRKEFCSLFVHDSSIPCNSYGIFAGQIFEEGDEVFRVPWYMPVDEGFIASFAFLTKFHPSLANINGPVFRRNVNETNQGEEFIFRATKRIAPGDELFLPFENHPASLLATGNDLVSIFESIPTLDQYNLVDKVTNSVDLKHKNIALVLGRRAKERITSFPIAHLLGLARSVLRYVDPIASELLPQKQDEFKKRQQHGGPAFLSILSNHSLSKLQVKGTCLTDIAPTDALSKTEQSAQTATKTFVKDDIVHSIPLFIQFRDDCSASEQEECTLGGAWAEESPCFSTYSSQVALCPLTGFQPLQSPDPDSPANVEVRWSSYSFSKISLEELKLAPAAALSLDVIALDAIDTNETLFVSDVAGLADKIIPKQWKV